MDALDIIFFNSKFVIIFNISFAIINLIRIKSSIEDCNCEPVPKNPSSASEPNAICFMTQLTLGFSDRRSSTIILSSTALGFKNCARCKGLNTTLSFSRGFSLFISSFIIGRCCVSTGFSVAVNQFKDGMSSVCLSIRVSWEYCRKIY